MFVYVGISILAWFGSHTKYIEVINTVYIASTSSVSTILITHAIAWINVIREYASKKMVDERTAT
jgi:hypothetical protein